MSQVELTNGEPEHLIIEGWKLYALIGACLLTFSVLTYGATTARSEVQKANSQLEQQKVSTGAKIDNLMNTISSNKKQWAEEQKKIDESTAKQDKLNYSTENMENTLKEVYKLTTN